jgi:purine-binding chemotaxis protein CheW
MHIDKEKTQLDSRHDLTLYIESLFQRDEEEVEAELLSEADETIAISSVIPEANNTTTEDEISELSNIPVWGQAPFECLLVKAAGMNYMMPALSVSYIERVNKKIIRIPLEADSFHGVLTLREQSVAVIDLFSLITEDITEENEVSSQITSHHIDHVMVMENSTYALACDQISKMITLQAEDVRWSKPNTGNPLYAGIVKEHLCPLINIDNLSQRISTMPFVQSLSENNH